MRFADARSGKLPTADANAANSRLHHRFVYINNTNMYSTYCTCIYVYIFFEEQVCLCLYFLCFFFQAWSTSAGAFRLCKSAAVDCRMPSVRVAYLSIKPFLTITIFRSCYIVVLRLGTMLRPAESSWGSQVGVAYIFNRSSFMLLFSIFFPMEQQLGRWGEKTSLRKAVQAFLANSVG